MYDEGGSLLTSLPIEALSGFPGLGDGSSETVGPLEVYYGSQSRSFRWAVVCSGVSAGMVSVHCFVTTDEGETFTILGDENAM